MGRLHQARGGFTLIELAIVLVVIGLIVGGVLVGQELIRAAGVRSTITQIEKYQTAMNTFRVKYGGLPGDLNASAASQFGFVPRGTQRGEGDGNGTIEAMDNPFGAANGVPQSMGETVTFWVDLSTAHLIDGSFNTATEISNPAGSIIGSSIDLYLPQAKLGGENYIYVWTYEKWTGAAWTSLGITYFGISAVSGITQDGVMSSTPGMTVAQAYAMDNKVDDGMPSSGRVTAEYLNGPVGGGQGYVWASPPNGTTILTKTAGSPTTCFDDGGNAANPVQYSLSQNGGTNVNCALSFQFQ